MKKFISIILAAVMAFSLIPSAFAEGAETDTGAITYKFTRGAFGESSNITNVLDYKYTDVKSGGKWQADGFTYMNNPTIYSNRLQVTCMRNNVDPQRGTNYTGYDGAVSLILNIEKTGTFTPELGYQTNKNCMIADIYLIKKDDVDNTSGYGAKASNAKLDKYISENCGSSAYLGQVDMYSSDSSRVDADPKVLNTVNITETGAYYLIFVERDKNPSAVIIADSGDSRSYMFVLTSFTLTPAETQEAVISAYELDDSKETTHSASVEPLFATTDGSSISATVSADDEDDDGVYTLTAAEKDTSGEYKFLYWIKGLTSDTANKIVSLTPTIEEYKPQKGNNFLIAVYEKIGLETSSKAEFYNGNGQLLSDLTLGENGELPALPSMAGYGNAKEWKKHNGSIYVAQYDDFTVKVNGKDVTYGNSVTFTADDDTDGNYFKWWTRTVNGVTEVVSADREYTFCPWEDCTVEAIYGNEKQILGGNLRKIALDVLGNDSIMAEFIGLDGANVAEKGIILTGGEWTKKIAMSTNNSQFTITNNIDATSATGYAIIKDGETFIEITDGTIGLN